MQLARLGALLLAAGVALAACVASPPPDPATLGPYLERSTSRPFTRWLPNGDSVQLWMAIWYPTRRDGRSRDRHPVIIFSHGRGGTPSASIQFLRHLASHGFVVAAPAHEDCATLDCRNDPAPIAAEAQRRPSDVISALETVLALNQSDADLGGLIDPSRVGLAGWSFGGYTALRVMELDDRFRAALLLAPEVRDFPDDLLQAPDPRGVHKPVMFMMGELDNLWPFQSVAAFYSDIPPMPADSVPARGSHVYIHGMLRILAIHVARP